MNLYEHNRHTFSQKAKTLSDLLWENVAEWNKWLRMGVTEKECVKLTPKYDEKWVLVSVAQQEIDDLKRQLEDKRFWSRSKGEALARCDHAHTELDLKVEKLERERGLQKQKLQLHLAKYPKDHFIRDVNGKSTGETFIAKEKDFEKWLKELEELLQE
jgi:hypothetical protein